MIDLEVVVMNFKTQLQWSSPKQGTHRGHLFITDWKSELFDEL